jgi:hypothetical protein
MSAPALTPSTVPTASASLALPAWRAAHEQRAAAQNTYLAARRRGETMTGAQLATRYGMSERWGRARIAEARAEAGNGTRHDNRQATSQPAPGHRAARTTGNGSRALPAQRDNRNGNGTDEAIPRTGNGPRAFAAAAGGLPASSNGTNPTRTDDGNGGRAQPAQQINDDGTKREIADTSGDQAKPVATVDQLPASSNGTSPTRTGAVPPTAAASSNLPALPASGSGTDRHDGRGARHAGSKAGSGTAPTTAAPNGYRSGPGVPLPGEGNADEPDDRSPSGMSDVAANGAPWRTHGDAGEAAMPATSVPSTAPAAAAAPETSNAQRRLMTTAVVVVAAVAATASYDHQRRLAELAGEGWQSWLLPLSVDGLLTAATMLMLTRRRAGQPAGTLTWTTLALGIVTSVAANVVGADPTLADPELVGRLVAAWPPLALFLSLELLMRQLGVRHDGSAR